MILLFYVEKLKKYYIYYTLHLFVLMSFLTYSSKMLNMKKKKKLLTKTFLLYVTERGKQI